MKMKRCNACGEYIVFLETESGKAMPVDADSVTEGDEEYDRNVHIAHWGTCSHPDLFRNAK